LGSYRLCGFNVVNCEKSGRHHPSGVAHAYTRPNEHARAATDHIYSVAHAYATSNPHLTAIYGYRNTKANSGTDTDTNIHTNSGASANEHANAYVHAYTCTYAINAYGYTCPADSYTRFAGWQHTGLAR
jgi:hypothetical protein